MSIPALLCYKTLTDMDTNEVCCSQCGLVIEEVFIPVEKRLELIFSYLLKKNFFRD